MIQIKLKFCVSELEQAFSIFDKDGDGSITNIELGDVLNDADVHFTQDQLDQFMAKLDKDGRKINMCTNICMSVCKHVSTYVCMYLCMYVYVYVCMFDDAEIMVVMSIKYSLCSVDENANMNTAVKIHCLSVHIITLVALQVTVQ